MRKDSTPRDMLLDRRVVERNIRAGIVTREEYDASLRALVDTGENAESIRARLGEDEVAPDVDETEEDDDAEG